MVAHPKKNKPKKFKNSDKAVAAIEAIYQKQVEHLCMQFKKFSAGKIPKRKVSGFYPYLKITVSETSFKKLQSGTRYSYGFVSKPGTYATTLTRLDIFSDYYRDQVKLLLGNHGGEVEVGLSNTPIPIHFALGEKFHLERDLTSEQMEALPNVFDQPDLENMDDEIANATHRVRKGNAEPLALFTAPRVDLSLLRLKHYTGTSAKDFQNFIIFTNYKFYIDEFITIGEERAGKDGYGDFIQPEGNDRQPQMPAYHLKRENGLGITMVNIGVGPSNAKTITDHIAVLRHYAGIMMGHCAGLRNSQEMGDYVLAHGYLREDNVLYHDLHPSIPIPALAEIQQALEASVREITSSEGSNVKKVMRTGTVATVDDRNWELRASIRQNRRFSQSRAIALDMESGTVAANGFRFRVPYGTLLCVSDKPLHGQLKLPGMADNFYRKRVGQHLLIGLRTMEKLREIGMENLHSRKLRSFNEVPFQ